MAASVLVALLEVGGWFASGVGASRTCHQPNTQQLSHNKRYWSQLTPMKLASSIGEKGSAVRNSRENIQSQREFTERRNL